jgi:hypothetical protein
MTEQGIAMPDEVMEGWTAAVKRGEPRAVELGMALALALPRDEPGVGNGKTDRLEVGEELREMLLDAHRKYDALTRGDFKRVDAANLNILAFERRTQEERLLIVNNMTRGPQPVKFRAFAGKQGWDILNRVEFTFPARAQLEAYEFLWLLVE